MKKYFLITVSSQSKPCSVVHHTTLVIDQTPIQWMLDWVKTTKARGDKPTPPYILHYAEEITKEEYDQFGEHEMSMWE